MLILENKFISSTNGPVCLQYKIASTGWHCKTGHDTQAYNIDSTEYAGIITLHILHFCEVALVYSGKHIKIEGLFQGCSSSFFSLCFFFSPQFCFIVFGARYKTSIHLKYKFLN